MPGDAFLDAGVALVTLVVFAAIVTALLLVWHDIRNDLHVRVQEDRPNPEPRPFDWQLDAMLDEEEHLELLARKARR